MQDLPNERGSARYGVIRDGGDTREIILNERKRQVVDALLNDELYCARLDRTHRRQRIPAQRGQQPAR